jgi:hypothetical protein
MKRFFLLACLTQATIGLAAEAAKTDSEGNSARIVEAPALVPMSEDIRPIDSDRIDLSPEMRELRAKIDKVLAHYQNRQLNTRDHTPWEVMHACVAFADDTRLRRDGVDGEPIDAIRWILDGGRCRGQRLLTLERGRPYAAQGVGVQGHPAQLLAILAQSNVGADTVIHLDGRQFVLEDLIDEEMLSCRENVELTFVLLSLSHYLPSDTVWRSRDGQRWSIPRLINAELRAPIRGAACGGTHRLFGLTYAYQYREREGRPVDGEFLRARQFITAYHRYTWSLQNADGSFSTEWFAGRGNRPDIHRKLQTGGHILEWMVQSLPDEHLAHPRTMKAVEFIADTLHDDLNGSWSIGPLGHALHALVIYRQRAFSTEVNGSEDGLSPALSDAGT